MAKAKPQKLRAALEAWEQSEAAHTEAFETDRLACDLYRGLSKSQRASFRKQTGMKHEQMLL